MSGVVFGVPHSESVYSAHAFGPWALYTPLGVFASTFGFWVALGWAGLGCGSVVVVVPAGAGGGNRGGPGGVAQLGLVLQLDRCGTINIQHDTVVPRSSVESAVMRRFEVHLPG